MHPRIPIRRQSSVPTNSGQTLMYQSNSPNRNSITSPERNPNEQYRHPPLLQQISFPCSVTEPSLPSAQNTSHINSLPPFLYSSSIHRNKQLPEPSNLQQQQNYEHNLPMRDNLKELDSSNSISKFRVMRGAILPHPELHIKLISTSSPNRQSSAQFHQSPETIRQQCLPTADIFSKSSQLSVHVQSNHKLQSMFLPISPRQKHNFLFLNCQATRQFLSQQDVPTVGVGGVARRAEEHYASSQSVNIHQTVRDQTKMMKIRSHSNEEYSVTKLPIPESRRLLPEIPTVCRSISRSVGRLARQDCLREEHDVVSHNAGNVRTFGDMKHQFNQIVDVAEEENIRPSYATYSNNKCNLFLESDELQYEWNNTGFSSEPRIIYNDGLDNGSHPYFTKPMVHSVENMIISEQSFNCCNQDCSALFPKNNINEIQVTSNRVIPRIPLIQNCLKRRHSRELPMQPDDNGLDTVNTTANQIQTLITVDTECTDGEPKFSERLKSQQMRSVSEDLTIKDNFPKLVTRRSLSHPEKETQELQAMVTSKIPSPRPLVDVPDKVRPSSKIPTLIIRRDSRGFLTKNEIKSMNVNNLKEKQISTSPNDSSQAVQNDGVTSKEIIQHLDKPPTTSNEFEISDNISFGYKTNIENTKENYKEDPIIKPYVSNLDEQEIQNTIEAAAIIFKKVVLQRRQERKAAEQGAYDSIESSSEWELKPTSINNCNYNIEADEFKLVFINSAGSTSSSHGDDDFKDESLSASSSIHNYCSFAMEDCDWDYFDPSLSNSKNCITHSTLASPLTQYQVTNNIKSCDNTCSPFESPLPCPMKLNQCPRIDEEYKFHADSSSSASSSIVRNQQILQPKMRIKSRFIQKDSNCRVKRNKTETEIVEPEAILQPHYLPISVPVPIPVPLLVYPDCCPNDLSPKLQTLQFIDGEYNFCATMHKFWNSINSNPTNASNYLQGATNAADAAAAATCTSASTATLLTTQQLNDSLKYSMPDLTAPTFSLLEMSQSYCSSSSGYGTTTTTGATIKTSLNAEKLSNTPYNTIQNCFNRHGSSIKTSDFGQCYLTQTLIDSAADEHNHQYYDTANQVICINSTGLREPLKSAILVAEKPSTGIDRVGGCVFIRKLETELDNGCWDNNLSIYCNHMNNTLNHAKISKTKKLLKKKYIGSADNKYSLYNKTNKKKHVEIKAERSKETKIESKTGTKQVSCCGGKLINLLTTTAFVNSPQSIRIGISSPITLNTITEPNTYTVTCIPVDSISCKNLRDNQTVEQRKTNNTIDCCNCKENKKSIARKEKGREKVTVIQKSLIDGKAFPADQQKCEINSHENNHSLVVIKPHLLQANQCDEEVDDDDDYDYGRKSTYMYDNNFDQQHCNDDDFVGSKADNNETIEKISATFQTKDSLIAKSKNQTSNTSLNSTVLTNVENPRCTTKTTTTDTKTVAPGTPAAYASKISVSIEPIVKVSYLVNQPEFTKITSEVNVLEATTATPFVFFDSGMTTAHRKYKNMIKINKTNISQSESNGYLLSECKFNTSSSSSFSSSDVINTDSADSDQFELIENGTIMNKGAKSTKSKLKNKSKIRNNRRMRGMYNVATATVVKSSSHQFEKLPTVNNNESDDPSDTTINSTESINSLTNDTTETEAATSKNDRVSRKRHFSKVFVVNRQNEMNKLHNNSSVSGTQSSSDANVEDSSDNDTNTERCGVILRCIKLLNEDTVNTEKFTNMANELNKNNNYNNNNFCKPSNTRDNNKGSDQINILLEEINDVTSHVENDLNNPNNANVVLNSIRLLLPDSDRDAVGLLLAKSTECHKKYDNGKVLFRELRQKPEPLNKESESDESACNSKNVQLTHSHILPFNMENSALVNIATTISETNVPLVTVDACKQLHTISNDVNRMLTMIKQTPEVELNLRKLKRNVEEINQNILTCFVVTNPITTNTTTTAVATTMVEAITTITTLQSCVETPTSPLISDKLQSESHAHNFLTPEQTPVNLNQKPVVSKLQNQSCSHAGIANNLTISAPAIGSNQQQFELESKSNKISGNNGGFIRNIQNNSKNNYQSPHDFYSNKHNICFISNLDNYNVVYHKDEYAHCESTVRLSDKSRNIENFTKMDGSINENNLVEAQKLRIVQKVLDNSKIERNANDVFSSCDCISENFKKLANACCTTKSNNSNKHNSLATMFASNITCTDSLNKGRVRRALQAFELPAVSSCDNDSSTMMINMAKQEQQFENQCSEARDEVKKQQLECNKADIESVNVAANNQKECFMNTDNSAKGKVLFTYSLTHVTTPATSILSKAKSEKTATAIANEATSTTTTAITITPALIITTAVPATTLAAAAATATATTTEITTTATTTINSNMAEPQNRSLFTNDMSGMQTVSMELQNDRDRTECSTHKNGSTLISDNNNCVQHIDDADNSVKSKSTISAEQQNDENIGNPITSNINSCSAKTCTSSNTYKTSTNYVSNEVSNYHKNGNINNLLTNANNEHNNKWNHNLRNTTANDVFRNVNSEVSQQTAVVADEIFKKSFVDSSNSIPKLNSSMGISVKINSSSNSSLTAKYRSLVTITEDLNNTNTISLKTPASIIKSDNLQVGKDLVNQLSEQHNCSNELQINNNNSNDSMLSYVDSLDHDINYVQGNGEMPLSNENNSLSYREYNENSAPNITFQQNKISRACLEDGLADDDSWVEELSEQDDTDNCILTAGNYLSSNIDYDQTFMDAFSDRDNNHESELRGYNRTAIDFTLHTIVEESCEESEITSTREPTDDDDCDNVDNLERRRQRTLQHHHRLSASELEKYFFFGLGDGKVMSSIDTRGEDTCSDVSSVYSEGVDTLAVVDDTIIDQRNTSELSSSRLEKYFLSGFMGFSTIEKIDTDETGSVGSDSEGQPSPSQRRKRLVRARSTPRSQNSSLDNLLMDSQSAGNNDNIENNATELLNSSESEDCDDTLINANVSDRLSEGNDTLKRKKQFRKRYDSIDEKKFNESTNTADDANKITINNLENLENRPSTLNINCSYVKRQHSNSRDSGFVGSNDDLLKTTESDAAISHLITESVAPFQNTSEKSEISDIQSQIDSNTIISEGNLTKNFVDDNTSNVNLIRKDSFNNWSSDEETNLMLSKMRQFFKTLVVATANSQQIIETNNSKPITAKITTPSSARRMKSDPATLAYFENELTRLMKTVPGINDEQVREIVEYLSSEDTWSDSYDSSDYTSSDLEGSNYKSEIRQQISDSCQQIINKFEINGKGDHGDGGVLEDCQNLPKNSSVVYQKLETSFSKSDIGNPNSPAAYIVEKLHNNVNQASTSQINSKMGEDNMSYNSRQSEKESPQLFAKVMQHIGERLVVLMHEVNNSNATNDSNSPIYIQNNGKQMQAKISASTTKNEEEAAGVVTNSNNRVCNNFHIHKKMLRSVEPNIYKPAMVLTDTAQKLARSQSHDFLLDSDTNSVLLVNATASNNVINISGSARPNCHLLSSGGSDTAAEECGVASDYERFSWRGSFESALLANGDSRTKLTQLDRDNSSSASALAIAKRRSAGDLFFNHNSLSREQLDRVRSCGSIAGGTAQHSILEELPTKSWLSSSDKNSIRPSSVPDAIYETDSSSEDSDPFRNSCSTLPRSLISGAPMSTTNSLPRLSTINNNLSVNLVANSTHSTSVLQATLAADNPSGAETALTTSKSHSGLSISIVSKAKSARYRPPGITARHNFTPASNNKKYTQLHEHVLQHFLYSKRGTRKKFNLSMEESRNAANEVVELSTLDQKASNIISSSLELHGSPFNETWPHQSDDDIDRLVAIHQSRSSLSSLGLRSESMASVYSGAGEARYGTVAVRGQVEFGIQYNYKLGSLEIHIVRCKDLAAVDVKRNRSDPYVKVYLLPDKSKVGKRKTKVKKHTLNPIFDEILRFHMSISNLESRTLWLTVWHSDMFGRNDFLGEVSINLQGKVFDNPDSQWYSLQERSEPYEEIATYRGDIVVGLKYVTANVNGSAFVNNSSNSVGAITPLVCGLKKFGSIKSVASTKADRHLKRGQLHILVKEAKHLTTVKPNGTCDAFCKSYLLPDRSRSSKQKTPIVKRSASPSWNYTFIYEDISLEDLSERALELTVWDHDRLASNEFLGGIRFSLGTGKSYGYPVDWMDASGKELSLWQSMLNRPNFWVEGSLELRATFDGFRHSP